MGAGTARRLMGLSDHAWVTHRKHSIRSCIWHGCSHPHENRFAHDPDHRTRTEWWKYGTRKELGKNLDWVDEVRENASIRMVDYQQRAAAHYNCKARPQVFKIGALVFRKVFENIAKKRSREVPSKLGRPLHYLESRWKQGLSSIKIRRNPITPSMECI